MRAGTLTLLLAAALAGACGRRELAFGGAVLRLEERVADAELAVRAPLPLEGIVDEVVWVRDGLANVIVSLRSADGVGGAAGGHALLRFGLPLVPAPPEAGGPDLPEIVGFPLERISTADPKAPANGFWLEGGQLGVVHSTAFRLPETLHLRYTVYAAQLAGTALGAGFARAETLVVRSRRGPVSATSLALPTGATFALTLPPVAAGRLEGAFRALGPARGGAQRDVEVALRVGGAVVFDEVLPSDGAPASLGTRSRPWIELAASPDERTLAIDVRGAPGGVVLFELPLWVRPRSWKEGPNVLLVVIGGLRADTLESHGGAGNATPEIDRLAGQALRFADAWATSSWALPSMATILTSTYGSEHLAVRHDRRLGRGVTTLAEVFRDAGYRTLAFTDGGFVAPLRGLDRGFDLFDASGGGAAAVVQRMREFLQQSPEGPWFALVHVGDPLPPYTPPAKARADVELRHHAAARLRAPNPAAYLDLARAGLPVPGALAAYMRDLYAEEVRAADRAIGALLDDLRARELFTDALIALTSDHGQEFGEHGFLGDGDTLYPEVLRVPLILKLPKNAKSGMTEREPVSLIDLAPTLLQGAELGSRLAGTGFDGVSLIGGRAPTPIFAEREHPVAGPIYALRDGRYLVVRGRPAFRGGLAVQTFDVVVDPGARNDLRDARGALTKSLLARIDAHLAEHPPRVEGAEVALAPALLAALDPLPGLAPERGNQ
jgi:arylsulfatase A-like enzyme